VVESKEAKESKESKEAKESKVERKNKFSLIVLIKENLLFILFFISFLAFVITKNTILAVTSGIFFVSFFVLDILKGTKEYGFKKELFEIALAAILALVFWFSISFLLNTSSPISAIVSCSMLPAYERGDFVVLSGAKPSEIAAPEVILSPEEFNEIYNRKHEICSTIGQIEYKCSNCTFLSSDKKEYVGIGVCSNKIKIKNQIISENLNNSVIVYVPRPLNANAYGDIIHRVFLKIKVGDETFFLTKGDNNIFFDTGIFNLIHEDEVKGKVLFRVPYLGYLKLFLSLSFQTPSGCGTIIER